MGNQLAQPSKVQPDHLAEIPNVVLKEHLGGGRFLKTVLCVHDEGGQVVVKVYTKRGELDLERYAQQLAHIRTRLSGLPCSHVWPFQYFFHTEKAAYLLRQHIFSNLYHRLSTRPFLASIEKHWIAFQLLHAVAQSHEQGICHGDIKCENVLVTSWHWIFLADFASFKPAYLPADNPADFSFFFDTGGRRRCYVAPERFFSSDAPDAAALGEASIQPSMDIFSLGCVIAELFLEGQRLFDLSELLAYRRGQYDPGPTLAKVEEPFRKLISHMINVDPGARLSAAEYLQKWGPTLFPFYFDSLIHPFFSSLLPMDPDNRIQAVQKEYDTILKTILGPGVATCHAASSMLPRQPRLPDATAEEDEVTGSKGALENAQALGSDAVSKISADVTELLSALKQPLQAPASRSSHNRSSEGAAGAERVKDSSAETHKTVVLEEAFDYQCRDRGKAFGEASTSGRVAALKEWQPPPMRRKEDIPLPAQPGWQWTDDWQVDRESPTDSRGWSYLMKGSPDSWSPKCKLDCLWRRRRWTRQRRKMQAETQRSTKGKVILGQEGGNVQGMVIVATLLCSTMRGARLQESKASAIALLAQTAEFCDDDTRLQRIVPYLMECMKVPLASVRFSALQGLVAVLRLIQSLPASDARVFSEYILPSLSLVPDDKEEWVRSAYAAAIGPLAECAHRFLISVQSSNPSSQALVRYEAEMHDLRVAVEKVVSEAVEGPRSTANTKRALLSTVHLLATFLGRRESNDFLLPMLKSFLDNRDWLLRLTLFKCATPLAAFAGPAGIEAFMLPFLLQALGDRQEAVAAQACYFLATITAEGLLRRRSLVALLSSGKVLPGLLHHQCAGVRAGAAEFAAAASSQLTPAEVYVFLQPKVAPSVSSAMPALHSPASIVAALPSPCPRPKLPTKPSMQTRSREKNGDRLARLDGRGPLFQASLPPLYSVKLDRKAVRSAQSALSAALQSNGNVDLGRMGDQPGAHRLLAKARRITKATPDMASVHGRLNPGLQIGNEEALSFQVDALRTPEPSVSSRVSSAMDAAIRTHLPTNATPPVISTLPWRPRGVLLTHLAEHKKAVNKIAVSGNGSFFASASSDETVKIWDCRRLEKDVTFRSRLTYASQGGKILACTACSDNQTMATASSNGSLHVWRVEYTTRPGGNPERYTGTVGKQQVNPGEGSILEVVQWDSLLLYSTQGGYLHAWDIRSSKDAWVLKANSSQGCWSALAVDAEGCNWLVAGSSRGWLALWDMRFQVCVRSWQVKERTPILAVAPALASPRRLGLPRLGTTAPLLYVAAGPDMIGLWDIGNARCHQVLKKQDANMEQISAISTDNQALSRDSLNHLAKHFSAEELQLYASSGLQGTQALLPTAAGPLLTGSSDGYIRCWDAAHIDQSYVVCGRPYGVDRQEGGAHVLRCGVSYGQRLAGDQHIIEELPLVRNTRDPSGSSDQEDRIAANRQHRRTANSHGDSVLHLTALQCADERLLLSAGADGVVKAWK